MKLHNSFVYTMYYNRFLCDAVVLTTRHPRYLDNLGPPIMISKCTARYLKKLPSFRRTEFNQKRFPNKVWYSIDMGEGGFLIRSANRDDGTFGVL